MNPITVYWTTKSGQKLDIDQMDIKHLKNILKMIVRNNQVNTPKTTQKSHRLNYFTLNGEMAQMMVDDAISAEMEEEAGYPYDDVPNQHTYSKWQESDSNQEPYAFDYL